MHDLMTMFGQRIGKGKEGKKMQKYFLEVCVDSVESAIAAEKGGADRLELCGHLPLGGVTPGIELFRAVRRAVKLPLHVLVRPRFGDFLYSEAGFDILRREVVLFRDLGADAVVIGCLCPDGSLDRKRLAELCDLAGGMKKTLHRAFDLCNDPFAALEQAKELGFNTILTSGQKDSCEQGMALIDALARRSGPVEILAGSGVGPEVVKRFMRETEVHSFHLSAKKRLNSGMVFRREGVHMGLQELSEYEILRTDEETVRQVKKLLERAE